MAPECSPDQRVDPAQTLTKKWYLPEEIAARTRRTVTILPDRHHEVLFDLCPGDARHLRHGWEEAVLHPEHLSGGQTAQKKFIIIICSEFHDFFKNQAHHII